MGGQGDYFGTPYQRFKDILGITMVFGSKNLPICVVCNKPRAGLNADGICLGCQHDQKAKLHALANPPVLSEEDIKRARAEKILLTTETWIGDVDRLGVVATEVVLGMNIFRDLLANLRDIVGGRSGAVQKTLEEARTAAFSELRYKALEMDAHAVISIDIDYHSISTGSAVNILMVAVSGTAVRFPEHDPDKA